MTEQYNPSFAATISSKACVFTNIPKELLLVDSSYQNQADLDEVARIKIGWNPFLCNPLNVAERHDGKYYVVDGQHRLLAAKTLDHVTTLPCNVFKSSGAQEEAQLYYQCNNNRRKPGVLEKYNSLVIAKDPTRLHMSQTIKSKGFSINTGTKRSVPIGSLIFVYDKYGESVFDKVMDIVDRLYMTGRAEPRIIKGIGYILSGKYIIPDYNVFVDTVVKVGPDFLYGGIKEHIFSAGHSGERIFAEGIAIRVNFLLNRKPKMKIMPVEEVKRE